MVSKIIETEKTVCRATFEREPSPEVIEAIRCMVDIAYSMDIKPKSRKQWFCNECNYPNFTELIPVEEIENEIHLCINCGGF